MNCVSCAGMKIHVYMEKWNWDWRETLICGQFNLYFCARRGTEHKSFSGVSFAFLHPGYAILSPTAEGMLWCFSRSGEGQRTSPWQCRAGWMPTSGHWVSCDCPCDSCATAVPSARADLFLGQPPDWGQGCFLSPLLHLPAKDWAVDTKAQKILFHFCWALVTTCSVLWGMTSWARNKTTQSAHPGVALYPVPLLPPSEFGGEIFRNWGKNSVECSSQDETGCSFVVEWGHVTATNMGDISVLGR